MYHSIKFGDKNTWDDWHLIPSSRPLFNPPEVKTKIVEIPGGDGVLDLTESLTGRPVFGNRNGSWTFYVENGYKDWSALFSEIMMYLHGKKYKVSLEDDPDYFYEGRFSVNQWKSDKDRSQIVIDYTVGPYKYKVDNTGDNWLWDTFNFETGIIRKYKNLSVLTSLEVIVVGEGTEPIVPVIIASASGMTVEFDGETYELYRGPNTIPEIKIQPGENTLTFNGRGIISIENIGGIL